MFYSFYFGFGILCCFCRIDGTGKLSGKENRSWHSSVLTLRGMDSTQLTPLQGYLYIKSRNTRSLCVLCL